MLYLQACINGSGIRLKAAQESIVNECLAVESLGVNSIHLHTKTEENFDSIHPDIVDRTISAIKQATKVPLGISTGEWMSPRSIDTREICIRKWNVTPDFASVNFWESNSEKICGALLEKNIGIEAGIKDLNSLERLIKSEISLLCIRIMLEPASEASKSEIIQLLAGTWNFCIKESITTPLLLHSSGKNTWSVMHLASILNLQTRIGLEDTNQLPNLTFTNSNTTLIKEAIKIQRTSHGFYD